MSERTILNTANVDPKALVAIAGFHADIVGEVQRAVTASPIVVVGMAQNPVVRKARKALDTAGVAYKYLEYGTYFSAWKPRLAIKMWSGWPTFPQVFVQGKLVGGAAELDALIAAGGLAGVQTA
jgi:monothiol glutaredoxin